MFQKSTLEVREAYRAYGFKVKLYQRVPDDHVSTMFVFMARLAERSLEAFRNGSLDGFRTLMVDQHTFARAHLNNWLPKYASLARSVKEAHLYPQLVQGAKAFARLDETFSAEAIAWVDGSTEEVALFLQSGTFVRPEAFDEMERAIEHMAALELVGLDENELVEM